MTNSTQPSLGARTVDPDAALRILSEATAGVTGRPFFRALVRNLVHALGTHGAWVTEYLPDAARLRSLAFYLDGEFVEQYEYPIAGTPCEAVINECRLIHIPENVVQLYPRDRDLAPLGAVSYLGVALTDPDGQVLGHLAVLDGRPMPPDPRLLAVFNIFAARAAAEHQRLAAESRLRDREQKLTQLIDTAMDAILDLDAELRVMLANPAAGRLFDRLPDALAGQALVDLFDPSSAATVQQTVQRLASAPQGPAAIWIPGRLEARRPDGRCFAAEGTLSRYLHAGNCCHTLILRDIADRVAAERTIQSLTAQTQYLQDELRELHEAGRILGDSPAIQRVLHDVQQVAPTSAAVLVLGETGTGKELIARAVHAASPRRRHPMVRVNCAAIPPALIESEFFGHEKGAFTGATQKREGRFTLADGGTLFLDEVGELPIELQPKLLRVLQEGEFEPVGSTRTVKVDVRIIAATNRDLLRAAQEGRFREDLYYRLGVFPIHVPPLRQRLEDIPQLARSFATRAAKRIGRPAPAVSDATIAQLQAYAWPGNIRELQNVIERAVIVSPPGQLELPFPLVSGAPSAPVAPPPDSSRTIIRTIPELQAIERDNIQRALQACAGRISGPSGAAQLLSLNPSTLRSRIKALGLDRTPIG